MELFADGLQMGESPRWHTDGRGGRFWVCDWLAGEVLSFDAAGERTVEHRVEGLPFSIDWLPDGRLVMTTSTGVVTGDGAAYGATGQGWNEIVVDTHGNTFVDAAGFDLMGGEEPKPGCVSVVRPDGSSREVATDVWFPNGMAVTPDGSTLLVAESYGHCLTAFDVAEDGGLSGRRVWADLGVGTPDGICLDDDGAIWYADVPHRCCVRVAEGGGVLDRVDVDAAASPACSAATTAGRSSSWPTPGAASASRPPAARCSHTGRLHRTPDVPSSARSRR